MLQNNTDLMKIKNYQGGLAIHQAVNESNLEMIKLLIAMGSDVNGKDAFGRTPLNLAYFKKNLTIVKTLLISGANPFINLEENNLRTEDFNTIIKRCQEIWNMVRGKSRETLMKQFLNISHPRDVLKEALEQM